VTPEQAFGRVMREFRLRRGLSQEDLGFESVYHRTYISFLERGIKSPTLSTMFRLAVALDAAPSQLVKAVERHGAKVSKRDPLR
jgi:transcriptional regulator with XRE-family HTH domain